MSDIHLEPGTVIKDSNVEILIVPDEPHQPRGRMFRTDYMPMLIVAFFMLAIAAYGLWARFIHH